MRVCEQLRGQLHQFRTFISPRRMLPDDIILVTAGRSKNSRLIVRDALSHVCGPKRRPGACTFRHFRCSLWPLQLLMVARLFMCSKLRLSLLHRNDSHFLLPGSRHRLVVGDWPIHHVFLYSLSPPLVCWNMCRRGIPHGRCHLSSCYFNLVTKDERIFSNPEASGFSCRRA